MTAEIIHNADGSKSIQVRKAVIMTVERDGNRILWHWTAADQTYVMTEEVASSFRDILNTILR